MSSSKVFRRKVVRRRSSSHSTQHAKQQQPQSFFDFSPQHSFFTPKANATAVNRKCDGCEKEDKKLQRAENTASSAHGVPAKTSSYIGSLPGKGSPLPAQTRKFFEPKFGSDFSHVKIHNDQESGEVASSLHARAFTHKNHIVFNNGQYNPESSSGKHLLAHELTHVLQQDNSIARKEVEQKEEEKLQRAKLADFDIKGLAPELKSVPNIIRFESGSTTVPAEDQWKIKAQATPPARALNLNGFTSEEGSAGRNIALVNGRISNVSNGLKSEGHTATRTPHADTTKGEGKSNYRSMRIVEILDPATPSNVPSCSPDTVPCGTALTGAFPKAIKKVVDAFVALALGDAATLSQVSNFFGATPPSVILRHLISLQGEMITLMAVHNAATDCHKTACDGSCEKGADAYINPSVTPAKMIFCESFVNTSSDDKRADTFIHEALHATPGLFSDDIAYAHTRRFRTLSDAEKLKNTDSYVALIRVLHDPAAAPPPTPVDTITGTANAAEKDFAQKAIDFLEQWLIAAKFTTGDLYSEIHSSLAGSPDWKNPPAKWFHFVMHDLSPLFGLTDPGTSPVGAPPAFPTPSKVDKVKMAGISDRYLRMRTVLHSATITLEKSTTGTERWAPNLGDKVEVLPSFFTKTEVDAIRHLIFLMLKGMSDVPASLTRAYGEGVDKIRTSNGVGP